MQLSQLGCVAAARPAQSTSAVVGAQGTQVKVTPMERLAKSAPNLNSVLLL